MHKMHMKFLAKIRSRRNGIQRRQPTFVSPYPIVNRMLSMHPNDAFMLQMEIEMWSEDDVRAAFDTGMSSDETVNFVWNQTWRRMGADLSRVLQARIDALPEDQRRQLADEIEQS